MAIDDEEDDEQYVSSEDPDFAPDDVPEAVSDPSQSDDDGDKEPGAKRRRLIDGDANGDNGDYDNSGDEEIIGKGRKGRKKQTSRASGLDDDVVDGQGGLIKTRRQRAEEKEERRLAASRGPVTVDVDLLWERMISGKPAQAVAGSPSADGEETIGKDKDTAEAEAGGDAVETAAAGHEEDTIRIKRSYKFAGRLHTEEKVVARNSAEAKLYLASQQAESSPEAAAAAARRPARKAFRSAFEPALDRGPDRRDLDLKLASRMKAGREAEAKRLNTVEKSKMDWASYVDKEGIQDELQMASRSKGSYNAREHFLARSEAIREDEARRARMAGRT